MKHYTVVIQVKEVHEPETVKDPRGYPVREGGTVVSTTRRVVDLFNLTIAAPTEGEAYARAQRVFQGYLNHFGTGEAGQS